MLLPLALLIPLIALGTGAAAASETAVPTYSIDAFLDTTNYSVAGFSPDGTHLLVSSDETGVYNAFALPLAGGKALQLTDSTTDSTFAISYFPNDERILFRRDQGGNELDHIYVRERDGRERDLTPGENLKAEFMQWSHDGEAFYIMSNARDSRAFDVFSVSTDDYTTTRIYTNTEALTPGPVSRDGRLLALTKTNTFVDQDVIVVDLDRGTTRNLTQGPNDVSNSPAFFGPKGEWLYIRTNAGDEFSYLARVNLESGQRETVYDAQWSVSNAFLSREGNLLALTINADGRSRPRLFRFPQMQALAVELLPEASVAIAAIAPQEQALALMAESGKRPGDVFVGKPGAEYQALTNALSTEIDPAHLVHGTVVRFASFDELTIPGILYRPHGASPSNRRPALVWVHGGPGGQSRIGYSALIQYLVNHGYLVYAINNRGSAGYGKTFYQLDDRRHGDVDLKDCIASKGMLTDTGVVDPDRIGIIGASYGGYMVLAALTFEPEAFDAGVNIFGVSNWVRTLQSIPPWWDFMRNALAQELGDFDDTEALRAKSPLFHADHISKPLLVLQGANDPRVLKAESDDIVAAARDNGVPVEYLVFDDEGHGFEKVENQRVAYRAIRDFLDRYLGAAEPAQDARLPSTPPA